MTEPKRLFEQVNDYANRADPYPLYAEMRKTPIIRQDDGSYIVSSYRLIKQLQHDPRISVDIRKRPPSDLRGQRAREMSSRGRPVPFLRLDPPEHDHIRRLVTRQFGPPHSPDMIDSMRGELAQLVHELIDRFQGRSRIDIVDDFAYPFPVSVICRLLGVPREDEARFHVWADALVASLDPLPQATGDQQEMGAEQAALEISQYMGELIAEHREHPGSDMLSRLITDYSPEGPLAPADLVVTSVLLLIAGHETTVNLIANSTLTLLRHPDVLERLRSDPELVIPFVEEVLRFEPPVQFNGQRTAIADITLDGVTIPQGSPVILMLAAANRDPERFPDPERFIPDRQDNEHFGFGDGIHYCFGAPLARLEVQIALNALVRRVIEPRLVIDPPPYRQNALLRGPRHLLIDITGIRQSLHFTGT
ncbi:cytochrome P450 [Ktedonosporobacter rubrisoli]|uniref:Cytochrome P450 n=2 Tax=Ktedonosporobacter rubrisoli TaxID=2509675 RepID=A0A4P6K7G1_KTERU|nr:cytochrome P450 [Ktedonosporobacter rubrisoli]